MTKKNLTQRSSQATRGQALVELAFAVPLLALLLFAIVQWGLLFNAYMTLRHAANITARTISLAGGTTTNATAIAQQAITPMLDTTKLASVVVTATSVSSANDSYTVKLTYNMPLILRFVVPGNIGSTKTLTSQAIYRKGG